MADFPVGTYSPRVKENRPGVVYDPTKKQVLFVEDISKLDDEVVAIETYLHANPPFSVVFHDHEELTGTLDGVNVVFTLSEVPTLGSELIFVNGQCQKLDDDYAIVNDKITFLNPPYGQRPWANYRT